MIGERLAELRKINGDTQQGMANKLHATLSAVRCWEQEKSSPSHEMLIAICKLKNMHISNTMYNVCVNAPMSIIKNDTVLETALISVSFWIIILIVFLTSLCYLFHVIMVFAGHESPL